MSVFEDVPKALGCRRDRRPTIETARNECLQAGYIFVSGGAGYVHDFGGGEKIRARLLRHVEDCGRTFGVRNEEMMSSGLR